MADSPLNPTPTPMATPVAVVPVPKPATPPKPQPRDSLRELFETVAFVVGLVLMLKLFVVEAFVIPTGSMAETLYGYQKMADCPECGFHFPVNSSSEVEPQDGQAVAIVGACCPNCRHRFTWKPGEGPANRSGDRVLVDKTLYHMRPPQPGDVVVFKYPVDPQIKHTAQNYIKRLWGLGGQTLAINGGDLFRSHGLEYPPDKRDENNELMYPRPKSDLHLWEGPEVDSKSGYVVQDRWRGGYTYHNTVKAVTEFENSRKAGFPTPADGPGFELIRKSNDHMLAMRRIVYDNEHQPKALGAKGMPPRWKAEVGWSADSDVAPRAFTHAGDSLEWIRYRHLEIRLADAWNEVANGTATVDPSGLSIVVKRPPNRDEDGRMVPVDPVKLPVPITNFLGYNSAIERSNFGENANRTTTEYWVGDLILECEANFLAADSEVVLELSKGPRRYQAHFKDGKVQLLRTGQGPPLTAADSGIAGPGKHHLRFANVDCRLRVSVDGKWLDFGSGADYSPDPLPEKFDTEDRMQEGWTAANDLAAPASIGAKGSAEVRKLTLWRDTYFTYSNSQMSEVARFADTYYVQPGHYLCLGDNSAQSSDSRKWGLVPERLMLGKAVFVFAPFINDDWTPRTDRVGMIR